MPDSARSSASWPSHDSRATSCSSLALWTTWDSSHSARSPSPWSRTATTALWMHVLPAKMSHKGRWGSPPFSYSWHCGTRTSLDDWHSVWGLSEGISHLRQVTGPPTNCAQLPSILECETSSGTSRTRIRVCGQWVPTSATWWSSSSPTSKWTQRTPSTSSCSWCASCWTVRTLGSWHIGLWGWWISLAVPINETECSKHCDQLDSHQAHSVSSCGLPHGGIPGECITPAPDALESSWRPWRRRYMAIPSRDWVRHRGRRPLVWTWSVWAMVYWSCYTRRPMDSFDAIVSSAVL